MFVYNVTIKIDPEIEKEWIEWMQKEHIPEVLSTGMFSENRFLRLLDLEEEDGLTFSAQYVTDSRDKYDQYIQLYAAELRKKGSERWGNRFIAFRTLMEEVVL
jgi:hypothetical protein